MTIRFSLLLSYLIISLASSALISIMFFNHFSAIMTEEIMSDLEHEADSMMERIDWYLFERIQDLTLMKNMEIMQTIEINDANMQLADFLTKMNLAYNGMSQNIISFGLHKNIIETHKKSVSQNIPLHHEPWHSVKMAGSQQVYLKTGGIDQPFFSLAVIIPNQMKQGNLRYLHADIKWESIYNVLEHPIPFEKEDPTSYALLIDQDHQIVAASTALREAGMLYTQLPDEWVSSFIEGSIQQVSLSAIDSGPWLITLSESSGHNAFKGLGWKIAIMTPLKGIEETATEIRNILFIFIAFTMFFAALISLWTSKRIAKPIIQLAKFARNFKPNRGIAPPQIKASIEVTELSKQFTLMIADLEKSQQEKVRMAKFAVISEMAAIMAHEIRTPLGILRSSSQMLAREKNLSPVAHEMIDFISSETTRLNELVTKLLESSRPKNPNYKQQPIIPVIEHSIELLASKIKQKSISITFDKVYHTEQLFYDWDQLLQVFLNLIMNAIQHIETDGHIAIKLKNSPDHITIQVSDNGSGVSADQKEKIFEAFYTDRQKGIGLGLTIVQQIINEHQGMISISDSPLGGTCFTIELPTTRKTDDD